jgi:hypothetical protein
VTANLSAARRSTNKTSADSKNATKESELESQNSNGNDVNSNSLPKTVAEVTQEESSDFKSPTKTRGNDCASIASEKFVSLNEKSLESDPAGNQNDPEINSNDFPADLSQSNQSATFKTPLQMPRAENDSSGTSAQASTSSNKFRRSKIAPRLNTSRKLTKSQVNFSFSLISSEVLSIARILGLRR